MKAKVRVGEEVIKQALFNYVKNATGEITFIFSDKEDFRGTKYGTTLTAEIELDVGDIIVGPVR